MRRLLSRFCRDESAAIAPMYALALPMLVVMAGVGFDYGRVMALDSELQAAADHAAIAAATQLDGRPGAISRAENAANDTFADETSAFVNETRFANDGDGRPITELTFRFFDGYENDAFGSETDEDEDAAVVEVTVDARRINYALTPIIDALATSSWDDAIGRAVAGIENATCNVPPLMFCQPEVDGEAISAFPTTADVGKGLQLHMRANEADPWAPGNFGFLTIPYAGLSGNPNRTLGLNSDALGCVGDDIESRTGVREPEADALNSRLDLPDNLTCNAAGDFCPSPNTTKNWVREEYHRNVSTNVIACDPDFNPQGNDEQAWVQDEWGNAGYARDTSFNGAVGNGNWNGTSWLNDVHGTTPASVLAELGESAPPSGPISRWQVYRWELNNVSRRAPRKMHSESELRANGKYNVRNYCSYATPVSEPPGYSSASSKDRRILTVAAVDCTSLNGHDVVKINKWVELFLVQPADEGSPNKEFFTEIKGPAQLAGGGSAFQFHAKRKVVLIR